MTFDEAMHQFHSVLRRQRIRPGKDVYSSVRSWFISTLTAAGIPESTAVVILNQYHQAFSPKRYELKTDYTTLANAIISEYKRTGNLEAALATAIDAARAVRERIRKSRIGPKIAKVMLTLVGVGLTAGAAAGVAATVADSASRSIAKASVPTAPPIAPPAPAQQVPPSKAASIAIPAGLALLALII